MAEGKDEGTHGLLFKSRAEKHSGMVFIDNSDGDDDDVPEWVGEINILHGWAEITAAVFVVLTLLLMFTQIGLHLHYNESDAYRIYTIRILVMVPIYSVTSYMGLHDPPNAVIYALIRDCYECLVLISFLQYCLTFLGGPQELARYLIAKQQAEIAEREEDERLGNDTKKVRTHAHHPPGCWCLCPCCPIWEPLQGKFSRPWGLGAEFVRLAMLGTLQYVPFSLLVTFASIIGFNYGVYHEGKFAFEDVYLYAILVRNWSQCWALYCLGLFYTNLHDELHKMNPLIKFAIIKSVVLFMWWQGVFVNMLEQAPLMKEADEGLLKRGWTTMQVGTSINNFLCIIEMLLIGIAMHYGFHYTEWASEEVREKQKNVGPFGALFATRMMGRVKKGVKGTGSVVYTSVTSAPKTLTKTAKFVVSPTDWHKFGASMASGSNQSKTTEKFGTGRVGDSEDEVIKWHAEKKKNGKPTKRKSGKIFSIRLPKLMNPDERFAMARLADGLNFMDLIKALNEINVLDEDDADAEDDDLEDGQDYDAEMSGLHMFRGQIDSVDLEGVDIAMGEDIVDGKVTGGIHDPNAKGGYTTPLEGASRNPSVDPRDKTRVIKRVPSGDKVIKSIPSAIKEGSRERSEAGGSSQASSKAPTPVMGLSPAGTPAGSRSGTPGKRASKSPLGRMLGKGSKDRTGTPPKGKSTSKSRSTSRGRMFGKGSKDRAAAAAEAEAAEPLVPKEEPPMDRGADP